MAWFLFFSTLFRGPTVLLKTFPAYYFLNSLMISLFFVHLYKSYMIVKLFLKHFSLDKVSCW